MWADVRSLNFIMKMEKLLKKQRGDMIRFVVPKCNSNVKHRLEDEEAKSIDSDN